MSDWILGLKKAASAWMPGVAAGELRRAEEEVGEPLPEELGALYVRLDGATFTSGVRLFPLRGRAGERGLLERAGEEADGLPPKGVWRFGTRGDGEPLFAIRKTALGTIGPAEAPEWLDALADDAWVYGLKSREGGVSLHRSLEQLLADLVPPAEMEEFGEQTFVRALQAVGSALDALQPVTSEGDRPAKSKRAPRGRGKPARTPASRTSGGGAKGKGRKPAAKVVRPARKTGASAKVKAAPARKQRGGGKVTPARRAPGKSPRSKPALGKSTARKAAKPSGRTPGGRSATRRPPPRRR